MTETVTLAIIVLAGNLFIAAGGFYLTRRKQPSEIKVKEATAARIDAAAGTEYIENQRRLLAEYSELSLSNAALQRKFGELDGAFIALTARNAQLERVIRTAIARAESAEKKAAAAEQTAQEYKALYEQMLVRVNGFPEQIDDGLRRIKELEAQIHAQRVAAGDAKTLSDQRVSDATSGTSAASDPAASLPTVDGALKIEGVVKLTEAKE